MYIGILRYRYRIFCKNIDIITDIRRSGLCCANLPSKVACPCPYMILNTKKDTGDGYAPPTHILWILRNLRPYIYIHLNEFSIFVIYALKQQIKPLRANF